MKIIKLIEIIFVTLCISSLICTCSCLSGRNLRKPTKDPFIDFTNEPDLKLITDDDDRPPSTFSGNVMQAKITSLKNSNHGKGKFGYNFETQNGINVAQIGKLRDDKTFVVSGSYSYTGADGKRYRVKYTADEFGYHPITELDDFELPEITPPPKVSNFVTKAPFSVKLSAPYTYPNSLNGLNADRDTVRFGKSLGDRSNEGNIYNKNFRSESHDFVYNSNFLQVNKPNYQDNNPISRLYLPVKPITTQPNYLPPQFSKHF